MKMAFIFFFMLAQFAPFIIFSTFNHLEVALFQIFLSEDSFNRIISSSLPVGCSSILPASLWFP